MKNTKYFLLSILLLLPMICYAQGLKFHSGELPINQRTSYSVFKKNAPSFTERLDIEFDMQLYPVSEIGYILRIKNNDGKQIYNLFFDGRGDNFFKLNEEGRFSLVTAKIDLPKLIDMKWFRMNISFDMENESVSIYINGEQAGTAHADLPESFSPEIVFGRSEHIIDVPSFTIKNLKIGGDDRYVFPLFERKGNAVHNTKGSIIGEAINPDWIINDYYTWQKIATFKSETAAGYNYNQERKEIYYFNRDTIWIFDTSKGTTEIKKFDKLCPINLTLGMNFIDSVHNRLYAYEVFYDHPEVYPSVASLDLDTFVWRKESYDRPPSQLHHHSCHFNPKTGTHTIYGGFGDMRYSEDFFTYNIENHKWSLIEDFSGDKLFPRYFSSMGYFEPTNSLFIFGGMGNESGEQAVGRYYFRDLYRINLDTKTITKMWEEIPWEGASSVPVREMIIPDENTIYTLCYPESVSDSHLQLYSFSIANGSYRILGDTIPIHSDKIATNANLYCDAKKSKLFATVQEFDDDIRSTLTVYSIEFPPITYEELIQYSKRSSIYLIKYFIIGFILLAAGIVLSIRQNAQKKRLSKQQEAVTSLPEIVPTTASTPNSLFLFGDFVIKNKHNKDIAYMISGKQEQTLLLILKHSRAGGISSRSLSALLWPDRPEDKTKNLRGVTINHLRNTLEEVDGIELVFQDSHFSIQCRKPFYCDYIRCMELVEKEDISEQEKEEILRIVLRGKFLQFSTIPMYDSFKDEVESKIEPILLIELEKNFRAGDYHKSINISNALFNIDPLNEKALSYQLKSFHRLKIEDQAYLKYQTFITDYRNIMGTNYHTSFKSLY